MSWTTDVVRRVLPNGLTVLVQRDTSAPVVAVVTHVRAGYFDEPDHWVGIAHVLEHMYFKGTARRGPGEIARETQRAGGYINAATIYDKTIYYTVLPSADGGLEAALDVQADALMHAALDPVELGRELEVIIQEANRKLDSPAAVTVETLYAVLFRVHRMRRWRIGTEAALRRLTPRDVRAYYETRYTPDRVIVALVGDVDVERAVRRADEMYGGWSRPAARVAGSPAEPPDPAPALKVLRGDVQRPLAAIGWRTVEALHDDAPALDVAADILGSGRGARLYRGVRLPGLASSARASHYTPTEVGVFQVALEGASDPIDHAVARSLELAAALGDAAPADEEVERVRALLATEWASRFEAMDGRAAALCEAEALGDYRLADTMCERLLAVTAEDVRRVARRYLDPRGASAVVYLPTAASSALDELAWPPALPAGDGLPSIEAATVVVRAGTARERERREYPGAIHRRSYAGADLLARRKRGSGLVSLGLVVPGVPAGETAEMAGISALLVRAALRGAGGLDADGLARAAERLGGGVAPYVGADAVGWWLTVRAGAASQAAELLRRIALEPTLADGDVTRERELVASDAGRVRDDMFRHPLQRVLAHAFAGDPYALPALGEPDTVRGLQPADVRRWAQTLAEGRAVAAAVGDLEDDELFDAMAPFADWTAAPHRAAREPAPWCATRGLERRLKAQTALAMAFPACPYGSPDRDPIIVLGTLLSGLAGRLFEELREQRSLAYTVAAVPWLARRGGALLTYIATSPEREEEAREAMLAQLERIRREPVSTVELERAGNYAAGAFELSQQRGRAVAGELVDAWVHGAIRELADTPRRLRAVTAEEVTRVAARVLDADQRAEYVVRGDGTDGGRDEREEGVATAPGRNCPADDAR